MVGDGVPLGAMLEVGAGVVVAGASSSLLQAMRRSKAGRSAEKRASPSLRQNGSDCRQHCGLQGQYSLSLSLSLSLSACQ
jgi:hypothetical protein